MSFGDFPPPLVDDDDALELARRRAAGRELVRTEAARELGAVLDAAEMEAVVAACRARGTVLFGAEMYRGLEHDAATAAAGALGSSGLASKAPWAARSRAPLITRPACCSSGNRSGSALAATAATR